VLTIILTLLGYYSGIAFWTIYDYVHYGQFVLAGILIFGIVIFFWIKKRNRLKNNYL
jgi:membrane-associated phospholipid phosphatase